mmetsp:Transcript_9220/g.18572  ORF Transcript_9220/g.18572 Transcript_9220/m.18572 type:complete len:400 (+) Transcript_9220:96-1295(+)
MGGGKHPLAFLGKKGFHTKNLKNVEKVWIAKEKEKNEEKKLLELQKQLVEERQLLELQQIQTAAGIRSAKNDKLDWMYEGPMSEALDEKEAEEHLLGKAFEAKDTKSAVNEQISRSSESFMVRAVAPPSKNDAFARMHEDPMMKIRAQELKAREAVVKNPLKMNKVKKVLESQLLADQEARRDHKREKKDAKKAMKKEKKKAKKEAKQDSKKERRQRSPSFSSSQSEDEKKDSGRSYRSGSSVDGKVPPKERDPRYGLQRGEVKSYAPDELGPSSEAKAKFKAANDQPVYNPRDQKRQRKECMSEEERERRLREMQTDASEHESNRAERIRKERAVALAESASTVAALSAASGGDGGDPSFIKDMEKSVYSGSIDMEERVKRNRQNHQKELGSDSFMRK